MTRLSLLNEDVRELVDNRLVPIFLAEKNIASLCKALNTSLQASSINEVIHPNRLRALLSDDVSRGVNESTFGLVRQAVQFYCAANNGWSDQASIRESELKDEFEKFRQSHSLPAEEIVERLGLPPAVGRKVLRIGESYASPTGSLVTQLPVSKKPTEPDWGFQDTAISCCLEAFRRKPAAKIGLILPTGAGKTRTALRLILEILSRSEDESGVVYWVTHLKNLRVQAYRELQKLLQIGGDQIPVGSAELLAKRIRFVMVSEIPNIFSKKETVPILVVVDEAHHAAAASYQPIFESGASVPGLFLTATPNRTDKLPIGIDEIAFTITYRELEERGVVIRPTFLEFPVPDFEWSEEQVEDLADFIIEETYGRFSKVLVLAPRVERVEEFYRVLRERLAQEIGHFLELDDIGFVHGGRNSLGMDNNEFLDIFAIKPRSILVSAQILLEGFDDTAIDTVILTYASTSVVRLMQASGRCVRYSPGKHSSYVVQARNDDLAYHFDQRWLYQEISDFLRPNLIDIDYTSKEDLSKKVRVMLDQHNVKVEERDRISKRLEEIVPGELCRILLFGFPYYGKIEQFEQEARWGAFLEIAENSPAFRSTFNAFCENGARLSDPSDFLTREAGSYGVVKNMSPGSTWRSLMGVLTSAYFAQEELYSGNPHANVSRPFKTHGPTTWLTYVTFSYRPSIPEELGDFLKDCYNRSQLVSEFLEAPKKHGLVVKFPLPLGDCEGWLLNQDQAQAFFDCISKARSSLKEVAPAEQIGELASFIAEADFPLLPSRLLMRIESFLNLEIYDIRVLSLTSLLTND